MRRYGGEHGYGLRREPHGTSYPHVNRLLKSAVPLPPEASTEPWAPPVDDQGQTSKCTGESTRTVAMATIGAKSGERCPDLSDQGIYTIGRCVDREDGARGPLVDEGAAPSQVYRGIEEWGIPLKSSWPSDPARINEEPRLDQLEVAAELRFGGAHELSSTPIARSFEGRSALVAGHAFTIAVDVTQAFEDYDGGVMTSAFLRGPSLGGHALAVLSYRTVAGRIVFRGRNSWGTSWGIDGDFDFDESFLAGIRTGHVFDASIGKNVALAA